MQTQGAKGTRACLASITLMPFAVTAAADRAAAASMARGSATTKTQPRNTTLLAPPHDQSTTIVKTCVTKVRNSEGAGWARPAAGESGKRRVRRNDRCGTNAGRRSR